MSTAGLSPTFVYLLSKPETNLAVCKIGEVEGKKEETTQAKPIIRVMCSS